MKEVLIIGCGNSLRADDGLGAYAVRQIAASPSPIQPKSLTPHQLTPDIAAAIHAACRVIFIDASIEDPPGAIRVRPVPCTVAPQIVLAHCPSPSSLVALVKRLYSECPPAVLVSMGACRFDYGAPFSPEVKRALPTLIDRVKRLIALWGSPTSVDRATTAFQFSCRESD